MTRINLLSPSHIYLIRHRKAINFFLYDFMEDPDRRLNAVLWTQNQNNAKEFYSEKSVEGFMQRNLRKRPCEIILVK